jgi:hypothetical protein
VVGGHRGICRRRVLQCRDMHHGPCAADLSDDAVAVAYERCHRLVLASLLDDDDAGVRVLDEVGDCPACLRGPVHFLAGMTAQSYADRAGRDEAVRIVQNLLAGAVDKRHGD